MPTKQRTFHYHQDGSGAEKWFHLASDENGTDLHVIHEWADKANLGERRIELSRFLANPSTTAQRKLLDLIATLVRANQK